MRYEDLAIELSGSTVKTEGGARVGRYRVRVLRSPDVGDMTADDAVAVEFDDKQLRLTLQKLEKRSLDGAGLIALGRTLASVLLPVSAIPGGADVRAFLARSLEKLGLDAGVRLRLHLPRELSDIPWEYTFVERDGGEGKDGFLALDPRIAFVRHEPLKNTPVATPLLKGDARVVAAFASAAGLPELDLDQEARVVATAFKDLEGIHYEACSQVTLEKLQRLLPGTGIFHFAGHGQFAKQMGASPGTYEGTGLLAFEGDERVEAEDLAVNLRGNQVRLVVLAACETGRRDGVGIWNGIAPALVKAEIPAVVAHQLSILDTCAIAFSRRFYEAVSGGLSLERAVAAGRIAAYNADSSGRDWGVPVLYLRAGDGQLFEGAADPAVRERARKSAEADVNVRVKQIKAGGVLVGADVVEMLAGKLAVKVVVAGSVFGEATGARLDRMDGGKLDVTLDVDTVEAGGRATGVKIGTMGGPRPRSISPGPKAMPPAVGSIPPGLESTVNVGTMSGGQATGTQINETANAGIAGGNVQIGSVTIYQGGAAPVGAPAPPIDLIEEKLRLDVAVPTTAVAQEPFDVVVAVRQPEAPVLSVADLEHVVSAAGSVFRGEHDEVVKYKIEVTGAGLEVTPPSYTLKLRPGRNSEEVAFQVMALKAGKRTVIVNAYQDDGALAAQTRLSVEVKVAVQL